MESQFCKRFKWTQTTPTFTSIAAGTNGNLAVDPQFVDATNFDLRLTAPSLCINAGDLDGLRSTNELDYFGNTRVFALRVDMGAHEFNGDKKLSTHRARRSRSDDLLERKRHGDDGRLRLGGSGMATLSNTGGAKRKARQ